MLRSRIEAIQKLNPQQHQKIVEVLQGMVNFFKYVLSRITKIT